jgi:hypothetical protein
MSVVSSPLKGLVVQPHLLCSRPAIVGWRVAEGSCRSSRRAMLVAVGQLASESPAAADWSECWRSRLAPVLSSCWEQSCISWRKHSCDWWWLCRSPHLYTLAARRRAPVDDEGVVMGTNWVVLVCVSREPGCRLWCINTTCSHYAVGDVLSVGL